MPGTSLRHARHATPLEINASPAGAGRMHQQGDKPSGAMLAQHANGDRAIDTALAPYDVPQRAAEAVEADRHDVAVQKRHARAEAQRVRPEEVHMDVAGPAMPVELEVVMLYVS